jgi:hypothetical protein
MGSRSRPRCNLRLYPLRHLAANKCNASVSKVDSNGEAALRAVPVEHAAAHARNLACSVEADECGKIIVDWSVIQVVSPL